MKSRSRTAGKRKAASAAVRRGAPRACAPARRSPSPPAAGARTRIAARREIIEAAARVFAERGFHGASTQDIADVLGIRQASLYYYFPSKEVALELVCLQGVEGFFETAQGDRRPAPARRARSSPA